MVPADLIRPVEMRAALAYSRRLMFAARPGLQKTNTRRVARTNKSHKKLRRHDLLRMSDASAHHWGATNRGRYPGTTRSLPIRCPREFTLPWLQDQKSHRNDLLRHNLGKTRQDKTGQDRTGHPLREYTKTNSAFAVIGQPRTTTWRKTVEMQTRQETPNTKQLVLCFATTRIFPAASRTTWR